MPHIEAATITIDRQGRLNINYGNRREIIGPQPPSTISFSAIRKSQKIIDRLGRTPVERFIDQIMSHLCQRCFLRNKKHIYNRNFVLRKQLIHKEGEILELKYFELEKR